MSFMFSIHEKIIEKLFPQKCTNCKHDFFGSELFNCRLNNMKKIKPKQCRKTDDLNNSQKSITMHEGVNGG